ncbi:hypothetical protein [Geotalea sp. SG265]|uniref:hypothetical protein n=1 Tax=Geotalea sp. SG265 TaxID=2922867 RepID=UPI001FB04A65|nr:hypothetical protein [Geotalea sp. SG265]
MKPGIWALAVVCTALAGIADADQMVITYRSGRMQTLHLDESSSAISGISYQPDNAAATGSPSSFLPPAGSTGKTAITAAPGAQGAPQTGRKPQVHMEWAQPLE